jgi:hypothetical protein
LYTQISGHVQEWLLFAGAWLVVKHLRTKGDSRDGDAIHADSLSCEDRSIPVPQKAVRFSDRSHPVVFSNNKVIYSVNKHNIYW